MSDTNAFCTSLPAGRLAPPLGGVSRDASCVALTPREAEMLFWVAQGKTNGEIGIILVMAEHTVKKHLYNLLPKLGVETRIAAALQAAEVLGLVPG